jgi:hypothetical protein
MSQVEDEQVCCIVCGDEVEEYKYAGNYIDNVCLCCTQTNEDEVIAEDLETISELKRSGGLSDYDEAIQLLKKLMLDYSHRTERNGIIDNAESQLMPELIQLYDECKNEGYMECECGDVVPNNMCEFIDEDMECCLCLPCAKKFREWEDDFENRGAAILCAEMRPVIDELFK